jgi:hypothetical protein
MLQRSQPRLIALALLGVGACSSDLDLTGGFADPGYEVAQGEAPPTLEERLLFCEENKPSACPSSDDSRMLRHGGLIDGAICQFELADQQQWASKGANIDRLGQHLPVVGVADLLKDLDHQGVVVANDHPELARLERLDRAYGWDAFDHQDKTWMPQGISGAADAAADERIAGRSVIAVSWYHNAKASGLGDRHEVARISFVDVTDPADIRYTHVVLADVVDEGGARPDLRPVRIHAGGIAWVGRYLYVADTTRGLRVFDTERILALDSHDDAFGYDPNTDRYRAYGHHYALPQVGAYFLTDQSCWHRFSFVAADHTSSPPSLVTGEFRDNDIAGKLMRWDLDGDRLAATGPGPGITHPSQVFHAQESDMQGAVSVDGAWYITSSGQDGAWGRLYRAERGAPSVASGWVIGPEDVMFSRRDQRLWSLSEFAGRRYIFAVGLANE